MTTVTTKDIGFVHIPGTSGLILVNDKYIALAPLCVDLGLVLNNEFNRLAQHPLTRVEIFDTELDGKKGKVPVIYKDDLIVWLAWLEEDITETNRPVLETYRKRYAKALKDHFDI